MMSLGSPRLIPEDTPSSQLSKVGMSVFYLLVVRFGGCGSDGCLRSPPAVSDGSYPCRERRSERGLSAASSLLTAPRCHANEEQRRRQSEFHPRSPEEKL